MNEEAEKVYQKLEEVISICLELKNNKKCRNLKKRSFTF